MDAIAFLLATGTAGMFMIYAFARFHLEVGSLNRSAQLIPSARLVDASATRLSRERKPATPRLRTHTAPL
jgi:hypothetical protein